MKYQIVQSSIKNIDTDVEIVFVLNKNFDHKWIKHKNLLEQMNFKGECEESIFLANERCIYVAIESLELDELRTASAKALKLLKNSNFKSAKIGLYVEKCVKKATIALVEGFELSNYEFNRYKSKKADEKNIEIFISSETYDDKDADIQKMELGVSFALITSNASNFAKDIVNTAPADYTSLQMADDAKKLEKLENVTCKIHDEKFLRENNMNAFLAVNRASPFPPRLLHVIYKPQNATKKVIFVGKGLTYDSGGLSLKPSDYMVSMKSDKSGGASALAILKGAAELKLPIEVHAIIGATENMIGGNAYKPDDVLIAKNGKTIEIRNTDAEGRLVLADCLCYAQEFEPDYLIDIATLTGACIVGVGEFTTGIMCHDGTLRDSFTKASNDSGELINPLFFNKYLKKLLKSSIADISNVSSSRYGGAITAGLFLDNFIKEEHKDKWVHLDIAGPAYLEKEWGYNSLGASAASVRMNLYWLNSLTKKEK